MTPSRLRTKRFASPLSTLAVCTTAALFSVGCGLEFSSETEAPAPCDVELPVISSNEDSSAATGQMNAPLTEEAGAALDDELEVLIALEEDRPLPDLLDSVRTRRLVPATKRGLRGPRGAELSARIPRSKVEQLRRAPGVRAVEEDRPVYALGVASMDEGITAVADPGAFAESSTQEAPWGVQRVGALDVWDQNRDAAFDPGAPTGQGIKVCVIDTGIDPTHPDLRDVYRGGHDFVDDDNDPTDASGAKRGSGHGTHVAATIAAQLGAGGKSNGLLAPGGVVGIAPGVEIYAVRVLNTEGAGRTSDTINAMRWCAENDMDIATLSLGSDKKSNLEREAFDHAWNSGLLIFAASGNEGSDEPVAYPAAYDSVIAVGAVDVRDSLGSFSQRGPEVELVAPGVDILSATLVDGGLVPALKLDGREIEARAMAGPGDVEEEILDCGLGDSVESCEQVRCGGFVAYVQRGQLEFAEKVRNVVAQGATAVIIGNNDEGNPDDPGRFTLGEGGPFPPTVSISREQAQALEGRLGSGMRSRVEVRGVDYRRMTGTSMATPHASGVAALVWSARPELRNDQLRALLGETALDLGEPGRDESFGFGLVQAVSAIR